LTLGPPGGFSQTLEVSGSTEAGDAKLTLLDQGTASGGIGDSGFLVLTSTDANAAATVDIAGGTLNNLGGWIKVEPGAGGGRFWHGALQQNQGILEIKESLTVLGAEPWRTSGSVWVRSGTTLRVDAGLVIKQALLVIEGTVQADTTVFGGFDVWNNAGPLTIDGDFIISHARLHLGVPDPNTGFDGLQATGAVTLGGTLAVSAAPPPSASLGETFPIVTAASRSGTFRKVQGGVIDPSSAKYVAPTYQPNGVMLEVRRAAVTIVPSTGPPGTSVTLNGSGWTAGDRVNFLLVDSAHQRFRLSPATKFDESGNFSAATTIPAGAATGAATIRTQSSLIKGLFIDKAFTVTSS
jgi:hypothetical protein